MNTFGNSQGGGDAARPEGIDRLCKEVLTHYHDGREKLIMRRYKEAADYFRKVIEQEDVLQSNCIEAKEAWFNSHCLLVSFYTFGMGVEKNLDEAARLYRKAAENGYAREQPWFGHYYCSGVGVDHDYTESAAWYHRAAMKGLPYAQERIARCYVKGKGAEKNLLEAEKWLKMAVAGANEGDRDYFEARYDSFRRMVLEGDDAYLWYRGGFAADGGDL